MNQTEGIKYGPEAVNMICSTVAVQKMYLMRGKSHSTWCRYHVPLKRTEKTTLFLQLQIKSISLKEAKYSFENWGLTGKRFRDNICFYSRQLCVHNI